jgi:hypothetical protein
MLDRIATLTMDLSTSTSSMIDFALDVSKPSKVAGMVTKLDNVVSESTSTKVALEAKANRVDTTDAVNLLATAVVACVYA